MQNVVGPTLVAMATTFGLGAEMSPTGSLDSLFLQFYAEVAEADSWMSDKRPLLASRDFGKDEDSVQVVSK